MAIIVITIILNYHHDHKKFRSFIFIMLMMLRAILRLLIVFNFFSSNYAQDHLYYPDAECVDYDDRYNQNHDYNQLKYI